MKKYEFKRCMITNQIKRRHAIPLYCVSLLCFLSLWFFNGCSANHSNNPEIPTPMKSPKSFLEQAVDWGNENLFAKIGDIFTDI